MKRNHRKSEEDINVPSAQQTRSSRHQAISQSTNQRTNERTNGGRRRQTDRHVEPTHSHSLTLTHSLTHSLTLTLSHSLTHSLSLTHSPSLTLTHSHSPSLTHSFQGVAVGFRSFVRPFVRSSVRCLRSFILFVEAFVRSFVRFVQPCSWRKRRNDVVRA